MAGQIAYKENEEPKEVHVVKRERKEGVGQEREKEKAVGMYRMR